jgi:hypothetical protein
MLPSPGDKLVNCLIDEILLTNDPDYAQVDLEIENTLRGKSRKKLREILNNPSAISALKYTPDGDPDNKTYIGTKTADRLNAFIPFWKWRRQYQYKKDEPTQYDEKLAFDYCGSR